MGRMREQVKKFSWENFVYEHDNVWKMIVSESWKRSK
jgi:hypothetical protein